jgi:magnesium transporter
MRTLQGIDGKELVKVNENWNVLTCVKEMRIQAENVSQCILSMWSMMKTD